VIRLPAVNIHGHCTTRDIRPPERQWATNHYLSGTRTSVQTQPIRAWVSH